MDIELLILYPAESWTCIDLEISFCKLSSTSLCIEFGADIGSISERFNPFVKEEVTQRERAGPLILCHQPGFVTIVHFLHWSGPKHGYPHTVLCRFPPNEMVEWEKLKGPAVIVVG